MPVCPNWILKSKPLAQQYGAMAKNWIPRLAYGCADWLRAPQPRSGVLHDGDLDWRREYADLDAVRNRFLDHA